MRHIDPFMKRMEVLLFMSFEEKIKVFTAAISDKLDDVDGEETTKIVIMRNFEKVVDQISFFKEWNNKYIAKK
jgi:hypothetical protein